MSKINYTLKTNAIDGKSLRYIEDYLVACGIDRNDVESFLKEPKESDKEPYQNLENIDTLLEVLHMGMLERKHFFLQVDSDADGVTSAAIFYNYFKTIWPEARIEFRMHENKEHGIIVDTIPIETDIVVIPDAGSNQLDELEMISRGGRTVLVIDHHLSDITMDLPNVHLVNNQLSPRFKNKNLSGAGMVYKVIEGYSERFHDGETHKQFMDLAAVGIISDMMDTRSVDNNYLIKNGLKTIYNPFLKALLEKQAYSISNTERPNKVDIAFYITPLINSVIRVGDNDLKELMFQAFISVGDNAEVFSRQYQGKTLEENLFDYVARSCINTKSSQDRQKLKSIEALMRRVKQEGLHHDQVIVLKTGREEVSQNITGLVAMELLKRYKKPVLVLRPRVENGIEYYAGSGRGKETEGFDSFRDLINQTGLADFAEGHDMAFGAQLKADQIPAFIKKANQLLADVDFNVDFAEVDYVFDKGINKMMLKEFAEVEDIYGNGIPQPKFVFHIVLGNDKSNYQVMGKNSDTFKFEYKNINFVQFKAEDTIEAIRNLDSALMSLTLIGRSQYSTFNGETTLQVVIDSAEVNPVAIEKLF
jgi:single-stranded-DNA-specific exonuclease